METVDPIVRKIPLDGLEEGLRSREIATLSAEGLRVVTSLVVEDRGSPTLLLVFAPMGSRDVENLSRRITLLAFPIAVIAIGDLILSILGWTV